MATTGRACAAAALVTRSSVDSASSGEDSSGDDHEVAALHNVVQIEQLGQEIPGGDDAPTNRSYDGSHTAAGSRATQARRVNVLAL